MSDSPAWMSENPEEAVAFVEKCEDMSVLAEVAKNATVSSAARAALDKLTDQKSVLYDILYAEDEATKCSLIDELLDPAALIIWDPPWRWNSYYDYTDDLTGVNWWTTTINGDFQKAILKCRNENLDKRGFVLLRDCSGFFSLGESVLTELLNICNDIGLHPIMFGDDKNLFIDLVTNKMWYFEIEDWPGSADDAATYAKVSIEPFDWPEYNSGLSAGGEKGI